MRKPVTGLLAAAAIVAGVAGCSLPEVLPLAGGTTAGPSPYGSWYEQHWAANSVALSAADSPDGDRRSGDVAAFEETPEADFDADAAAERLGGAPVVNEPMGSPPPAVESNARLGEPAVDFDNSSPYQFPSSSFAPKGNAVPETEPHTGQQIVPPKGGPIRY